MEQLKKTLLISVAALLVLTSGCATTQTSHSTENAPSLDPANPVVITVWHYHTGAVLNAFDAMVREFNETVGIERGIIAEAISFGGIPDLEAAVSASAHQEVGSMELPNVFASFPDTAYVAQQLGLLANLDDYFTAEQQAEYHPPFMDRGRIGDDGELRIFPVAKSAEVMFINETDWLPFAAEQGFTHSDLQTMQGVARVAQAYYNWSGGRAFFGRDAFANLFVIGSKQFGTEIFEVTDGRATININETAMRHIWDYYYTPFISGYFAAYGRFRSDDVRVGDLLAYVGSTASAVFFPDEVRVDGQSRPIQASVLPAPIFEGGERIMIQQGAGMVVTLATPEKQYASLVFLRWFTEPDNNLRFSALTGRIPVRKAAMDAGLVKAAAAQSNISLLDITYETLDVAISEISTSQVYATSFFTGGVEARAIINTNLRNKALADRQEVLSLIENGTPREEVIAELASEENFKAWVAQLESELNAAVAGS